MEEDRIRRDAVGEYIPMMCRVGQLLIDIGSQLRKGCEESEAAGMTEGIQTFFMIAGENACYALCIVKIAEHENDHSIDVVRALFDGVREKHIRFDDKDWLASDNFFVDKPAGFLRMMTGKNWQIRHEKADYKPKIGEYIVERWERQTTGRTWAHFRLPYWDPLIESQTVRYGQIVSMRVFWQT